MEYQEAKYIIDYFPRLMTLLERKALHYNMVSTKLGKVEDYDSIEIFEQRKHFFERKLGYDINSEEVAELLKDGYNNFILKTAKRIEENAADEYRINKCPNCNAITKTPYANLCLKCKLSWHSRVAGYFSFKSLGKRNGSTNMWLEGMRIKGSIDVGDCIDLTFFQLNIIAEIKEIKTEPKSINRVGEASMSLGINLNSKEEKLVTEYLTQSGREIMILKRKE